jgi:hypothetical protein
MPWEVHQTGEYHRDLRQARVTTPLPAAASKTAYGDKDAARLAKSAGTI